MKILYATEPDAEGRHLIYYAVWDRDWFPFSHSTNAPLSTLELDEIDANKPLCAALVTSLGKVDAEGERKYYVDAAGAIIEKDGWEEHYDDI